jgi:hypothetical protein
MYTGASVPDIKSMQLLYTQDIAGYQDKFSSFGSPVRMPNILLIRKLKHLPNLAPWLGSLE